MYTVLTTVSPFPPRNGPTLRTRRSYVWAYTRARLYINALVTTTIHVLYVSFVTCYNDIYSWFQFNFRIISYSTQIGIHFTYLYLYRPCSSVLVLTSPSSSVAIVMTTPPRAGSTLPVTMSPGLPRKEATSSGQSRRGNEWVRFNCHFWEPIIFNQSVQFIK